MTTPHHDHQHCGHKHDHGMPAQSSWLSWLQNKWLGQALLAIVVITASLLLAYGYMRLTALMETPAQRHWRQLQELRKIADRP